MMKTFNLNIPGFTIACKAWGDESLPAMLAVHGWLDNANSFDLLAPYLEKDFHLIAIDLPGHGQSSHLPAGCHYHFIDGIFTVVQILDALNLRQVHLLGHSLGACLASLVAGIVPERILSMALLEGLGPFSSPDYSCHKQLDQYLRTLNSEQKPAKPYQSMELAARTRAKRGYLSFEHSLLLCERGMKKDEDLFYWRHDRRLLIPTPLRMTEAQILSCLAAVTAPSCLIWAEGGFDFNHMDVQARINAIKNLKVYKLEGGHHVHMEKPDAVAQHLAKFYQD